MSVCVPESLSIHKYAKECVWKCVCVFTESGDVQSLRSETCTSLRSPVKPLYNPHTLQSAPLPHYPSICFQCFNHLLASFWPSLKLLSILYSFFPFFLIDRIEAGVQYVRNLTSPYGVLSAHVWRQKWSWVRSSNTTYFLTCYTWPRVTSQARGNSHIIHIHRVVSRRSCMLSEFRVTLAALSCYIGFGEGFHTPATPTKLFIWDSLSSCWKLFLL